MSRPGGSVRSCSAMATRKGSARGHQPGTPVVVLVASAFNDAAPFVVFGAFMLLFAVQARQRGQSVNDYLYARNREAFASMKPGWWKVPVAFAAVLWAALWIASGFKPIGLVALPLVVGWVPFWGVVFRAYF